MGASRTRSRDIAQDDAVDSRPFLVLGGRLLTAIPVDCACGEITISGGHRRMSAIVRVAAGQAGVGHAVLSLAQWWLMSACKGLQ